MRRCRLIKLIIFVFTFTILVFQLPAMAKTTGQLKEELCPGGRAATHRIVKDTSHFQWQDRHKPLVFPAKNYPNCKEFFKEHAKKWEIDASKYLCKSLRLIVPKVVNKKFVGIYAEEAESAAAEAGAAKVTPEHVAKALIKLAECCKMPIETKVIPKTLPELDNLLNPIKKLSTPVPASELAP